MRNWLRTVQLTLNPRQGGELVPNVREGDNIKQGPDAEWTRRQPLVDVSKVKPEAGTEIVTRESAGFWWVLSPHREEDGFPNLFVMNDTAFRQAFYCVAVGPDAPWDPPPSPAKLKLTAFSHSGYA